jgi:hypothetical protein
MLCAVVLATLAALVGAAQAAACECGPVVLPGPALEQADLVFFGRVSFAGRGPGDDAGDPKLDFVEFSVEGVWKGPAQARLRVHPSTSGPECSVAFEASKRYLVYAYLDASAYSNRYHTSVCSRTREAEHSAPDLAILGAPPHRFEH